MNTYKITITTTFEKEYEIEADTAAKAQQFAEDELLDGALDCEPDTTINVELKK